MKKIVILFILICFGFSQTNILEEEINLDDLDESTEGSGGCPRNQNAFEKLSDTGLSFHIYGDFAIDLSFQQYLTTNLNTDWKKSFNFSKNHFYLLGSIGFRDRVQVDFTLASLEYFEMTYNHSEKLSVSIGKIWIPFGEPKFHFLYGGEIDWNGDFMPKIFTDYGISVSYKPHKMANFDFFSVNGFRVSGIHPLETPSLNMMSLGKDNNIAKALGLRYKMMPKSIFDLSFSFMYDCFSDENYLNDFVLLYGSDFRLQMKRVEFKGGFIGNEIVNHNSTLSNNFIFTKNTYYRWGYYIETSLNLPDDAKIRLRHGGLERDSRIKDSGDVFSLNLSYLFHISPFAFNLTYVYNFERYPNRVVISGELLGRGHQVYLMTIIHL